MSGFLYFIPNRESVSADELKSLPVAYAFDAGESPFNRALHNGPGGQGGVIIGSQKRLKAGEVKYQADKQTWVHHKLAGYWVGMWNESVPEPSTLERTEQLQGQYVEMGDGNKWLIPVARRWNANESDADFGTWEHMLPRLLEWTGDDNFIYGRVVPKYAQLWAIATASFNTRHDHPKEEPLSKPEERQLMEGSNGILSAILALQANYVVSSAEVSMLGLLHSDTAGRIFDALIDWDNYMLLIKKKASLLADGVPSSSGAEETLPTTDQPCSIATA